MHPDVAGKGDEKGKSDEKAKPEEGKAGAKADEKPGTRDEDAQKDKAGEGKKPAVISPLALEAARSAPTREFSPHPIRR